MSHDTTTKPNDEQTKRSQFDHVESVASALQSITNGRRTTYEVFSDWVDMLMAVTMAGRGEHIYQAAIEPYTPEELDGFQEAFAHLMLAMDDTQTEALGDTYMLLGMNSENLAQHFTPHSASEMMANLTVESTEPEDGVIKIVDPACGSGRLLVGAGSFLHDEDETGHFVGVDKDGLCAKMAAVNMAFFNLEGRVFHADSLSMDVWSGWESTSTSMGTGVLRDVPEEDLPDELGLE